MWYADNGILGTCREISPGAEIKRGIIMNAKALHTLEFDKIMHKLEDHASSHMAKELCRRLVPSTDLREIREWQQETADALSRVLQSGRLSFSGLADIRPSLMRLNVGGTLGMGELLSISACLDVTLRVKGFSQKRAESLPPDTLTERFSFLEPLSPINNEIKRCILSEEVMADDASPGLKSVRRAITNANNKIKDQLGSMVNEAAARGHLQSNIVTMRNGRYCLPVKQEFRSQVQGMIHDQSSSGSTVFVEPMAIVKLNNELAELAIEEQKEIEKVLATLSNEVGEHLSELEYNLKTLIQCDFIFAKAELAKQMKATMPDFNNDRRIRIKRGRHPLIDPHKVVPIDIHLGDEFNLLVVTGPNTGGKTVSLKTVGLLTLMGQAGLHIPAFDHSELGVFEEVFADIGDEQSIEQSLSTFSSHMVNTVRILEQADSNSLVLFDELGAGTDPTEGAALAMSILSWLHALDARVMATTHYSELKIFALTTPGVSNASCEFSLETLQPTYRLLIGIPGKSNAFAISSKLGLPDHIIQDAQSRIDTNEQKFEDVISDLEDSRKAMEAEQAQIAAYRAEAEALKKELEQQKEKLAAQKDKLLSQAREEAANVLQEAKDYADETIRKFQKWGASASAREMEQERSALRGKINEQNKGRKLATRTPGGKKLTAKDLRIGDAVRVLSLNLRGTVSTLPNAKGDLYVQMGILRSLVNISDLELMQEQEVTGPSIQKTGGGKIKMSKSISIHPELNLIGKTTDEAVFELDKYLDDAYLAHLPQVRIIHGRGTGALRAAVHAHLKKTKYVKSFRIGEFGEGDHGVTIVEFKD